MEIRALHALAQICVMLLAFLLSSMLSETTGELDSATVSARIVRAISASQSDWSSRSSRHRREMIAKTPEGDEYLLRVIDYE